MKTLTQQTQMTCKQGTTAVQAPTRGVKFLKKGPGVVFSRIDICAGTN